MLSLFTHEDAKTETLPHYSGGKWDKLYPSKAYDKSNLMEIGLPMIITIHRGQMCLGLCCFMKNCKALWWHTYQYAKIYMQISKLCVNPASQNLILEKYWRTGNWRHILRIYLSFGNIWINTAFIWLKQANITVNISNQTVTFNHIFQILIAKW